MTDVAEVLEHIGALTLVVAAFLAVIAIILGIFTVIGMFVAWALANAGLDIAVSGPTGFYIGLVLLVLSILFGTE